MWDLTYKLLELEQFVEKLIFQSKNVSGPGVWNVIFSLVLLIFWF